MAPWVGERLRVCIAITIAAVMAVPIGVFADVSSDAKAAPTSTSLRIGILGNVDSLNPFVGFYESDSLIYSLIYDSLMGVGEDLQPVPNLATSWYAVPLDDPEMITNSYPFGSVWQYNLSHSAVWSDGQPFNADDVVFNINLNAGNFSSMWKYQPYMFYVEDAVRIDDYTVRIHFVDRVSGDPKPVAFGGSLYTPILPEHVLSGMTALNISFAWNGTSATNPPMIGTGPFMPTSTIWHDFFVGTNMTLVRNPNSHWISDYGMDVHFDKLELYFYDDVLAMEIALKTSAIDVAKFTPLTYFSLVGQGPANIDFYGGASVTGRWTGVGFCMDSAGPNPSRLDRNIRQALSMAVDKSYVVENYCYGLGEEGSTLISPINSFWHYEPNASEKAQMSLNIAAANALLNASGYPRPSGNPEGIRICSNTSAAVTEFGVVEGTQLTYQILINHEYPEDKDIGFYLQQAWFAIGVGLSILVLSEPAFYSQLYMYQYDTAIVSWSSDIDPNYQLYAETREAWGGWSDNRWSNESYDENYSRSVSEMDPALRQVWVDNCQRTNYLDAPYIILSYGNQSYAWRTDTFAGWGDWAAYPGRSVDNYWTGNPLWFDLIPLANVPEFPSVLAPVLGMLGAILLAMVVVASRRRIQP